MDVLLEEGISIDDTPALSYDDTVPYEEQVAALSITDTSETRKSGLSGLAGRISTNKIYLAPENAKGKVRVV